MDGTWAGQEKGFEQPSAVIPGRSFVSVAVSSAPSKVVIRFDGLSVGNHIPNGFQSLVL